MLDLVLVILTSVVIASAVDPATRWFMSYKLPRAVSVLLIYVLAFLIIFGFLYIFIPPLFLDISELARAIPESAEDLDSFGDRLGIITQFTGDFDVSSLEELIVDIRSGLADLSGGFFSTASTFFGGAFSFILIVVLSFYLAVQEKGIENFLRIVTPLYHEKYVLNLWERSKSKIGQWMKGQMLLALIVGVLVYLGLTILQVPYAFVLAVLAAMFEIIPIFGPIISAIPAIILGFSDSVTLGLMVMGLYLIIQQFENHLIYPLVVKKIVGVPPLLVIIALIAGGMLFGFLGIILAIPFATILMELSSDAEKRKMRLQEMSKK